MFLSWMFKQGGRQPVLSWPLLGLGYNLLMQLLHLWGCPCYQTFCKQSGEQVACIQDAAWGVHTAGWCFSKELPGLTVWCMVDNGDGFITGFYYLSILFDIIYLDIINFIQIAGFFTCCMFFSMSCKIVTLFLDFWIIKVLGRIFAKLNGDLVKGNTLRTFKCYCYHCFTIMM